MELLPSKTNEIKVVLRRKKREENASSAL
jgi:hypothetical protein